MRKLSIYLMLAVMLITIIPTHTYASGRLLGGLFNRSRSRVTVNNFVSAPAVSSFSSYSTYNAEQVQQVQKVREIQQLQVRQSYYAPQQVKYLAQVVEPIYARVQVQQQYVQPVQVRSSYYSAPVRSSFNSGYCGSAQSIYQSYTQPQYAPQYSQPLQSNYCPNCPPSAPLMNPATAVDPGARSRIAELQAETELTRAQNQNLALQIQALRIQQQGGGTAPPLQQPPAKP